MLLPVPYNIYAKCEMFLKNEIFLNRVLSIALYGSSLAPPKRDQVYMTISYMTSDGLYLVK